MSLSVKINKADTARSEPWGSFVSHACAPPVTRKEQNHAALGGAAGGAGTQPAGPVLPRGCVLRPRALPIPSPLCPPPLRLRGSSGGGCRQKGALPYLVPLVRLPKENRGHVQAIKTPVWGKRRSSQGHQRGEDVQGAGERGRFQPSTEPSTPRSPPSPPCTLQPLSQRGPWLLPNDPATLRAPRARHGGFPECCHCCTRRFWGTVGIGQPPPHCPPCTAWLGTRGRHRVTPRQKVQAQGLSAPTPAAPAAPGKCGLAFASRSTSHRSQNGK